MNRRRFTGLIAAAPVAIGNAPTFTLSQTPDTSLMDSVTGPILGDLGSRVDVHMFSDFQSHFCRDFHDSTLPLIAKDFMITGQVRLIFHDFPRIGTDPSKADPSNLEVELRDPNNESSLAAQAAMSAGEQGRYLEMSNLLFHNFSGAQLGTFKRDNLDQFAIELGLDMQVFAESMDSGRHISALAASIASGQASGIVAVPMFILDNGNGAPNVIQQTVNGYDLLKRQIELSVSTAK